MHQAIRLFLSLAFALLLSVPAPAQAKKVLFIAGRPSHGYGAHEHNAGCLLLAKYLKQAMPDFQVDVVTNGWPKDEKVFDGVDAIVMYCDGGGGHMVNPHLKFVDELAKKGVGIGCIHYAVEVPKGDPGDHFLKWIGGYFETDWSVNPHWTAKFDKFPNHAITRGVKPFEINDEWYYHMRFPEGMKGVTPILSDLPGADTLRRPDGAHSGNPAVRKAVANGEEQHVMWAYQRPDGGRGFGFTGGHVHWNWADDNFRKVVLNGIVWIAKGEVPENGVQTQTPSRESLEENQDEAKPGQKKQAAKPAAPRNAGKPKFASKVVTSATKGHAVDVDVDISGAKKLYLVINDGGNGFACDWADWVEPRLVNAAGKELKLTEQKWNSATTGWGQVRINQNCEGREMKVDGKPVAYGIGAHANSVIAYDIPAGYTRFKAQGGLDVGGTSQQGGSQTSVQFLVYLDKVPVVVASSGGGGGDAGQREPEHAVENLEVADGLEATLFASEPMTLSPTNIDVDHLGRVWVCEVVNYRHRNGSRPEGDRILILEDTNGDGKADKQTVFYQGRDIDTALGICVLGNKVIVSVAPNVFVFTDEDGDGKADKKELLFTKVGQPQHDHSTHAFLFGPDGKLYFCVGNTGGAVHDKDGKIIVDLDGNEVRNAGRPYREGMPFRCNLDGSDFEVLGWNFRNNYEVTVDSFGTLWQSDNDDDGNRGVRINYVMEFGNYGYKGEMTGASWQTPRTNWESEIPLRHWHQNDPGVVPNLLQTGAGSPTGICVYEGNLLPKVFQNQVVHCDAGPNVVRAYPAVKSGAGYTAEVANILEGARDKWFRPSDVCVAPDGSLIVADWYDPGVGGHRMGDIDKGRIFRVAPPESPYKMPKYDFNSIPGAIKALQSPNLSTRYLAWTALHAKGKEAEPGLLELYNQSDNPRFRARALWLLGKIDGRGQHYVDLAIKDKNPDIRIVGLRLARQLKGVEVIPVVKQLAKDNAPEVRRECCIALRHNKSSESPSLWAELAAQHDGKDRWYLEALGIAADGQWDTFFNAWLEKVGDNWDSPAGHDIVWRARADAAVPMLAKLIASQKTTAQEIPRYFRAFDFHQGDEAEKKQVLVALLTAKHPAQSEIRKLALERLGNSNSPAVKAAVLAAVKDASEPGEFVELVTRFDVKDRYGDVLKLAQQHPDEQIGVEAIRALLGKNEVGLIKQSIDSKDLELAVATVRALGNSGEGKVTGLLLSLITDSKRPDQIRREATRGVARNKNGAQQLIKLAKAGQLPEQVKFAAAVPLNTAPWREIQVEAEKLFPLPAGKDNSSLPPLADLLKMQGDAQRGAAIFAKQGTCANCHKVNGQGKEVGPDLSGIGKKLAREAFFESILYPSAGISHNYETHAVALTSGNVVVGIITSQTGDSLSIKDKEAIVRTFKKSEIDEIVKQKISLMPADLQKLMTAQDLADVVAFLQTLKQDSAKGGSE